MPNGKTSLGNPRKEMQPKIKFHLYLDLCGDGLEVRNRHYSGFDKILDGVQWLPIIKRRGWKRVEQAQRYALPATVMFKEI